MLRMVDVRSDDTRNILSAIPLFRGLGELQLGWISQRAHRRMFPAGTRIITAEQPGEAVYIILFGTVKIHIEQADGRDVVLSIIGAGDTLGVNLREIANICKVEPEPGTEEVKK